MKPRPPPGRVEQALPPAEVRSDVTLLTAIGHAHHGHRLPWPIDPKIPA